MVENGLYKIKDEYYIDFPHEKHIHIKEGRPFYYAVKDNHGVYWFIPLSTQMDTFKKKINAVEEKRGKGNCMGYHIGIVANREMVFRICDMIPVIDKYVAGEFLKYGSHYIIKQENLIKEINQKARNYIKQIELGRMYSQVDALGICEKLITQTQST